MRKVVITGLGLVSPVGNNVQDSWDNALKGKSGITRIKMLEDANYTVQIAGNTKNFDASGIVDSKEINRMSLFCQYSAVSAHQVMDDSGLDIDKEDPTRCGVSIGVGLGSLGSIEESSEALRTKGQRKVSPFFLPYTIPNMASGIVSRDFNLKGPNMCTTTACASGTHAIGEAYMYIKQNIADMMVAGGAESVICPLGVIGFANMKALSRNNEDPAKSSRPFDKNRDGFVIGEGCGLVLLEEYEHAKKRGAKIYAELVGYGLSGDAYHITAPAPGGDGGKRSMLMALKSSDASLDKISYINAHGTSTKLNDYYESLAIQSVFGDQALKIPISSTKGVTGHCLGAAGGIEAVFTSLTVYNNIAPPTANYETPDPDCSLDYIPEGARDLKVDYALSNSFGFGGTNGTLVFKKI